MIMARAFMMMILIVPGVSADVNDSGDDTLYGGAGDDHLFGGLGDDLLDGGADDDTVDYSDISTTIDLTVTASNTVVTGVDVGVDTLVSIETIKGGTNNEHLPFCISRFGWLSTY